MATNRYGLNESYYALQLNKVIAQLENYEPHELARALARLAYLADDQIAVTTIQHLELEGSCDGDSN